MAAQRPVGNARRQAAHDVAGGRIAQQMRIERSEEAIVGNRGPGAEQEVVPGEMGLESSEKGLIGGLDRRHAVRIDAQPGQGAGEIRHRLCHQRPLFFRRQVREGEGAELAMGKVAIIGPAIVHGRDHQPLIAEEFQDQGSQALAHTVRIDRRTRLVLLDIIDDVGRVLQGDARVPSRHGAQRPE